MTALRVDPRDVARAEVHVAGRLAAHLTRDGDDIRFTYTPHYLADPGPPVATTLPLTDAPVVTHGGAVPAYFAGLLPEGRRLTHLRRAVKTSGDDELSLLIAVGDDPVGDAQVLLPGAEPALDAGAEVVDGDWAAVSFSGILAGQGIDPGALAGVQDKVSGRMLTVPLEREGRRHLLKIDPPEYPHVVENEAYFLRVAGRLRVGAARAEVVRDRDGVAGLLVERFDRPADGTGVGRLAVEDAAQLLGRHPSAKYTLTTEDVLARIADVSSARLLAARAVLQQVALAWLTGNGDLHAKNLSVVRQDGEWRPSPIYDVPSTLPYGDHTLALPVAGRRDSLSRKRWLALADGIDLPRAAAERALDEVLAVTGTVLDDLDGAWPLDPRALRDMRRVLGRRRDLLAG